MVLLFKGIAPPSQFPTTIAIAKGTKSEVAGPKSGRNCYITPASSGVPNKGDKIRSDYITPPLEK